MGKDEVINFTPQYNSLQKKQPSSIKVKKGLFDENRKSLALPDMFSDLRNVELSSGLRNKRKKSNKNSSKNSSKQKKRYDEAN